MVETPPGGKPYYDPDKLQDPWGKQFIYEPQGQHNAAKGKPDVYTTNPDGLRIGNW